MMDILNTKTARAVITITALIAILILPASVSGDTIALDDGTVLVGKVIKEDDEKIIFNNAYGLFTVRKEQIVEKYITQDYREDIDIHKKLGKSYNEKEIKDNFNAGIEAKKKFRESGDYHWYSGGEFFLSLSYFVTTGKMNTVLPSGYCISGGYDNTLDFLLDWNRHWWMPAARFEAGYMFYDRDPARISGPMFLLGPLWKFDIVKKKYGRAVFTPLSGISFLKIEYEDKSENSNTFLTHAVIGYEYSFGIVKAFLQFRYKFIYDRDVDFNGFGASIGAGAGFW